MSRVATRLVGTVQSSSTLALRAERFIQDAARAAALQYGAASRVSEGDRTDQATVRFTLV